MDLYCQKDSTSKIQDPRWKIQGPFCVYALFLRTSTQTAGHFVEYLSAKPRIMLIIIFTSVDKMKWWETSETYDGYLTLIIIICARPTMDIVSTLWCEHPFTHHACRYAENQGMPSQARTYYVFIPANIQACVDWPFSQQGPTDCTLRKNGCKSKIIIQSQVRLSYRKILFTFFYCHLSVFTYVRYGHCPSVRTYRCDPRNKARAPAKLCPPS